MDNDKIRVTLLGSNDITRAIAKVLSFLEVELTFEINESSNILVMADSPIEANVQQVVVGNLNTIVKQDLFLLYFEAATDNCTRNPFGFLTEIIPTYRIPLENISIIELVKVIEGI